MNKGIEKLEKISWEAGYSSGVRNTKIIAKKYLARLTKPPLQVLNGGTALTSRELGRGLEGQIKIHMDKKKKLWTMAERSNRLKND